MADLQPELHPNSRRVSDAAAAQGLIIDVRHFPEGTRTADDAAAAIGVTVGQIAKSLVFVVDERPVLAIMSGSNRLDEARLTKAMAGSQCRKADASITRAATGFAIGGVPPFGLATDVAVFVDRDLLQYDVVWAAGGTPSACFAVTPGELVRVSGGTVADLRQDLESLRDQIG